jgi:MFS family permease
MAHSDLEKASHNDGTHSVVSADDSAHIGVQRVEATHRVFGKYSRWLLFISLGLAAYVYSLDGTTTYYYLQFATSELNGHSLLTTVAVVQAMIIACGKPIIAKVSDVTSRGYAFLVVLVSYVIGYIIIASAKSVGAVAAGIVFYAMGYTGLQVLNSIIIADITTLKWRGLVSGLMSLPFVVNAFVAANIQADILSRSGWRWGYGMFAILVPASISPLIITLVWAENKAKKLGFAPPVRVATGSMGARTWGLFQKLDLPGLFLLGAGVTLVLLPMTLAARALDGWGNGGMIAMVVIGVLLLPAFAVYEWKVATFPVIPSRFLKNKAVTVAAAIGFFDFVSFYLTWAYLNSFVYVVKHDWSAVNLSYFGNTQTVALTVFGILAGFIMRFTGRYKYIQIFGLCVRLLGVGIMIHSRGADGSDAELVVSQIIQGFGGGFAAVTSQVGAQASVPHVDVATVTAFVLLVTEIGGAVGNAIAGGIWSNLMPGKLSRQLSPFMNQTSIDEIYNSIIVAAAYPDGDPIRQGVINAYGEVMHIMLIVAIVVAVIPILLTLFMPNYKLGDYQNAVDQKKLSGDTQSVDSGETHDEKREGVAHSVDRT